MDLDKLTPEKLNDWLFQQYKKGDRAQWAQSVANSVAFMNGLQWLEANAKKLESENKPALVDNEITPAIDLLVANETENEPRFNASGRENSDASLAADASDFFSYLWDLSDGNEKIERTVRDFEVAGLGSVQAYFNPNASLGEGEIMFTDVDPQSLYIDPNSKQEDTEDSAHKLIVTVKTREQIKNWIPGFDFTKANRMQEVDEPTHDRRASQDEILNINDDTHDRYRVIDRYTKIKEKRYKVEDTLTGWKKVFTKEEYIEFGNQPAIVMVKAGQQMYVTKPSVVQSWLGIREQYGEVIHYMLDGTIAPGAETDYADETGNMPVPGSTTQIVETNMTELLNLGIIKWSTPLIDRIRRVLTVGDVLVENVVLPISRYPIVTFMLHHNRNPFPQGDVALVKPLQEQLNKIDSLIITYNTNIANVKVFLPKGSGQDKKVIEKDLGKAGMFVGEYDPEEGVPIFVQLTQMSTALYEQRQILIQQIQRILGSYSFQDGNVQDAPQTKGGTLIIEENMQKRTKLKRKKIERAINRLAKVILEMIPYVYTDRKVVRIIKPNHGTKQIVFNDPVQAEQGTSQLINDLSMIEDVQMISGSMMPTNRAARAEMMKDLYVNRIITDNMPILEVLDLPNLEEIKEREDMIKQATQMVQGLQEEIKNLQGQLQTKTREVIQANEKVEVMKTKTDLKDLVNKTEANTVVAQMRLNDAVKINKPKQPSTQKSKAKE